MKSQSVNSDSTVLCNLFNWASFWQLSPGQVGCPSAELCFCSGVTVDPTFTWVEPRFFRLADTSANHLRKRLKEAGGRTQSPEETHFRSGTQLYAEKSPQRKPNRSAEILSVQLWLIRDDPPKDPEPTGIRLSRLLVLMGVNDGMREHHQLEAETAFIAHSPPFTDILGHFGPRKSKWNVIFRPWGSRWL